MTELGVSNAKVTCPKNIEGKQGTSFDCTIETDGKSYTIVGTITKVDGSKVNFDTAWKNGEKGVVVRDKLVAALTPELDKALMASTKMTCAEPLLFLDDTRTVSCDLTAGTTKTKVLTTFDDKLVPTNWKLEPLALAKHKVEEIVTASVKEKFPTATVDCGTEPLIVRPADGFIYCTGTSGSEKAKLKIEVDENLNLKRWDAVAN